MYLITVSFQGARSRNRPDKPGKIYLSVKERSVGNDGVAVVVGRDINTGIEAADKDSVCEHYDEVVPFLYVAYRAIERLRNERPEFTVDDVVDDIRARIDAGSVAGMCVEDGFVWKTEVAKLKKEYRKFFRMSKSGNAVARTSDPENGDKSLIGYLRYMSECSLTEGRESSASSYTSSQRSLTRFLNGRKMDLADVNREFVEEYAEWLRSDGVSSSTQSFYLRTLRMAVNHATARGFADINKDMFLGLNTKVSYVRQRGNMLDRRAILKISEMDLSGDANLDLARDLFMFGFYCRGMELTDIINLTRDNIRDGVLTYQKRGGGHRQTSPLDAQALVIVRKYEGSGGKYLFPLKTADDIRLDKSLKNKISLWLNDVGKQLGLPSLTFNMNIRAWQTLVAQLSPSALLQSASGCTC